MDLSISHGQAQRLLKQRNLLAITATGLFGLSVLLTLTAAHRDHEVVLQPVLAKPLTLSSSHVDKDYLELVTRDAALLTLNRSPSNLQYWMDSILEITSKRLGVTCVVDDAGKLLGVITDGDLRRLLEKTTDLAVLTAREMMTSNPKRIKPEQLASYALQKMESHKITCLPVIDGDEKPVGIVHLHDLVNLGLRIR